MITPEWEAAIRRARDASVVMVIGETDTGKTTLITRLAADLAADGLVGVVDADLGQSEIGPPTTIGYGRVRGPIARLAQVEPTALYFVGSTSPAGNVLATVVGTRRLVDRARSDGCRHVLLDTSGLVSGELGRALKHAKIELVDPDLIISLERAGECESIVGTYRSARRPVVLRLAASAAAQARSAEARRRYREDRLRAYFADARPLTLDLTHVGLRGPDDALADSQGALVGLESAARETLGLGVVRRLDLPRQALHIDARVTAGPIAVVTLGREKLARAGAVEVPGSQPA